MPAIISDQFRILNAENFTKSIIGIGQTLNRYYTFIYNFAAVRVPLSGFMASFYP